MALDIDLDGFGFLESNSETKMPTFNKQPPISPIESESSSGISSLDSDDLKVSYCLLLIIGHRNLKHSLNAPQNENHEL